jgi:hypothetical protein
MTTYIDNSVNAPVAAPANSVFEGLNTDVQNPFFCLWADLNNASPGGGVQKRTTLFTQFSKNYKATTIILSDEANTLVEVSADLQTDIAGLTTEAPEVIWTTLTSAAFMSIPSPVTAIRITNTGTGAISARVA